MNDITFRRSSEEMLALTHKLWIHGDPVDTAQAAANAPSGAIRRLSDLQTLTLMQRLPAPPVADATFARSVRHG